ncbi:MAG TPA: hypothetical protein VE954_22210 [Oligoflexus sp.]|uniref:hypothetical protein n=1 Tax=Oligoflexus sp. TaxID=1971216 RepID=UPI002D685F84|nr:hypothetical protein [Oligoflexus sp.]HYX35822.1 hypothetical protein [Oligoflexus sp.]
MKNNSISALLTLFCALNPSALISGSTTGGGIGTVTLDQQQMETLQLSMRNDELIRLTRPGENKIYLRSNKDKIMPKSIAAKILPSGEEVMFTSESSEERIQTTLSLSIARSMMSTMPGVLPVVPKDIQPELKPKVETLPISSLDAETLQNLNIQP